MTTDQPCGEAEALTEASHSISNPLPDEIEIDGVVVARFSDVRSGKLSSKQVNALLTRLRAARKALEPVLPESASIQDRRLAEEPMKAIGRRIFWLQLEVGKVAQKERAERDRTLRDAAKKDKHKPQALGDEIEDRYGNVLATFSDIRADRMSAKAVSDLLEWIESEKREFDAEWSECVSRGDADGAAAARAQSKLRGRQTFELGVQLGRLKRSRTHRKEAVERDGAALKIAVPDEIRDRDGEILARLSDVQEGNLSIEEVDALVARLAKDHQTIRDQLNEARERKDFSNEPADPEWVYRAQIAARIKNRHMRLLNVELGKMKRDAALALAGTGKPVLSLEDAQQYTTAEEIKAAMAELNKSRDAIKESIRAEKARAKETGIPVATAWLNTVGMARKNLGRRILLLSQMLGRINDQEKAARRAAPGEVSQEHMQQRADQQRQGKGSLFPPWLNKRDRSAMIQSAFVSVAKDWLPPDLFQSVMEEAKRLAVEEASKQDATEPTKGNRHE